MIPRIFAALAVCVAALGAAAAPISVLLIGDSITDGMSSAPVGPSYAALLAESLGSDYAVTNIGCGGTSSLDWSRDAVATFCGTGGVPAPNLYQALAVPQLPAELVTILLGTNDAIGFFEPSPVSAALYGQAIFELTTALIADGAERVMLMTPPPNYFDGFAQLLLSDYRDAILALCSAPGDAILCGPDAFALLQPDDFAPFDLHPNGRGHQKLADALHEAVVAAVPEPDVGALLALGLAGFTAVRRSRARRANRRLTACTAPRKVPARVRKTG